MKKHTVWKYRNTLPNSDDYSAAHRTQTHTHSISIRYAHGPSPVYIPPRARITVSACFLLGAGSRDDTNKTPSIQKEDSTRGKKQFRSRYFLSWINMEWRLQRWKKTEWNKGMVNVELSRLNKENSKKLKTKNWTVLQSKVFENAADFRTRL